MAKPLNERIQSALSTDRVTLTTLDALVGEVREARTRESAAHVKASAESVDYALGESDRDDAAAKAERYARNAAALSKALDELEAKLTAKRESETIRAREAARAAAIAERDELAADFAEEVPALIDRLTALFQAVIANAERMKAEGLNEADAEAKARGLKGFLGYAGDPEPFTKMKVPRFEGAGRCWPPEKPLNVDLGRDGMLAQRRAMQAERERWKRYLVEPPQDASGKVLIDTERGKVDATRLPVIVRMTAEQADAAGKLGCAVRLAKPGETIGMPQLSAF